MSRSTMLFSSWKLFRETLFFDGGGCLIENSPSKTWTCSNDIGNSKIFFSCSSIASEMLLVGGR